MKFSVEYDGKELARFYSRLAADLFAAIESLGLSGLVVKDLEQERRDFEEARRKQRATEEAEQKRRHAQAVKAYEEEQERKRAAELAEASRIDWQRMKDEADARWNHKKPKEQPIQFVHGWNTGAWPSSCGVSGYIVRGDVVCPPWPGGDR